MEDPALESYGLREKSRRFQWSGGNLRGCEGGEKLVLRAQDFGGPPDRTPDLPAERLLDRRDQFPAQTISRVPQVGIGRILRENSS